MGKDYSFRPYFIRALQNGESLYVAKGMTSKQLGIYYAQVCPALMTKAWVLGH